MKRLTFIMLLTALMLHAAENPFRNEISHMLDMVYRGDYQGALSVADSIENISPITGKYMKMSVLNTYMSDFETDTLKDEFFSHYEDVIRERNSKDIFILYYVGGAYFQKSSYLAMKGNYTGALQHGLKALNYFNRVIETDTTMYDAYLGIGLIDYFRKFLPGMGSKAEAGKREIIRAAENGLFSKIPAYDMLAMFYMMEDRFDSAMYYSDILADMYPENRMFMFTRIKILIAAEEYEQCINVLNILEENLMLNQPETFYNHGFVLYNKALCYSETGDMEMAGQYIDRVLELSAFIDEDKRINEYIKKAKSLEKEIR